MSYTASAFLDSDGQYAKDAERVAVVRLFTGAGCEHTDIAVGAYNKLPPTEQQAIKLLPGRPECIA